MKTLLIASLFSLALTAQAGPGEQCLDSFRHTLKDPESGKVLSFNGSTVVYTATNSYGGRVQSSAPCKLEGDKWVRNKELADKIAIAIWQLNKIEKFVNCLDRQNSRRASIDVCGPRPSDGDAEAKEALGLN